MSKIVLLDRMLAAWEPFNQRVNRWFDRTKTFECLPAASRARLTNLDLRNYDPIRFYLDAFDSSSDIALPGVDALGFKLFPQHSAELFWKLSASTSSKIIIIERVNRLDSYVSFILASMNGRWIGNNDHMENKIIFDIVNFEIYKSFIDSVYLGLKENLTRMGIEFIYFEYNEIVNSEKPFICICDFIGIKYSNIKNSLKKQINFNPINAFSNRDAAIEYFMENNPDNFMQTD